MKHLLILLCFASFFIACKQEKSTTKNESEASELKSSSKSFGAVKEGVVELYTLENKVGMKATISSYGAILQSLIVPDKEGKMADVVLGFDKLKDYVAKHPSFGSTVGRYANRIAGGKFTLDGKEYQLAKNDGLNHLHGGVKGFDKYLWKAEEVSAHNAVGVAFSRTSPDMEEGYPGNLEVKVTYWLTKDNELKLEYEARTDKNTVCNLTHHSYFNLAGAGNGDILDHILMIDADRFTPVDENLIPTGELAKVDGTPLDFREPTVVGARINMSHKQLQLGRGYDHNWVLNHGGKGIAKVASVYEPNSGRFMEVSTTEPGLQVYCGNFLDGSKIGKGGKTYKYRYGLCLETQHFPDSPNQAHFPTTTLKVGDVYRTTTVYKFGVK